MFITPSFKTSLIVEQFQGNYLNSRLQLYLVLSLQQHIQFRTSNWNTSLDKLLCQDWKVRNGPVSFTLRDATEIAISFSCHNPFCKMQHDKSIEYPWEKKIVKLSQ